ncbi:MAG TPA: hypothetical protein VJ792_03900 [Candidatus Nitrosotalea sp.]|nr:hypothetical protein [Candidatus Nitrosotalea sp.]
MGRTIPSFRIALYQEERRWRQFRMGLDRKDRAALDRLFLASRLHISACMMAARPVRIHCIMMAMLLHQYRQVLELGGE